MPGWAQTVAEIVGWWVIGTALVACALVAAGGYMDRQPSDVEQLADDRLAHVNAWAASRQDRTTQALEDLYRLPSR